VAFALLLLGQGAVVFALLPLAWALVAFDLLLLAWVVVTSAFGSALAVVKVVEAAEAAEPVELAEAVELVEAAEPGCSLVAAPYAVDAAQEDTSYAVATAACSAGTAMGYPAYPERASAHHTAVVVATAVLAVAACASAFALAMKWRVSGPFALSCLPWSASL
jgi:hypothetical protein